jgi:hypothetical protein
MATSSTSMLHRFPSQEGILNYLAQYLTQEENRYLTETKIIQAVANFFANQKSMEVEIEVGVMKTLDKFNEELRIPEVNLVIIRCCLIELLTNCAKANR